MIVKVETLKIEDVKIGDWVRFWSAGDLVIGVVQYPPYEEICGSFKIPTDIGITTGNSVVELRRDDAESNE